MRTFGLVVLALVVGVLGFIPLFSVLFVAPVSITAWGASNVGVAGLTLGIYFVGGAAIGYSKPSGWIIGALLAWPGVFSSLSNLALAISTPEVRKAIPLAVLVLLVPMAFALSGAYLGRTWRRRKPYNVPG